MIDQTETVCVLAGLAAVGAIYFAQGENRFRGNSKFNTECSARQASLGPSGVSARAAQVQPDSETVPVFEGDMWNNMSTDSEESMKKNAPALPGGGANTDATKKNRDFVKPMLSLETTGAKMVGLKPLIPGRSASTTKAGPKVSGDFFYMTDAYADQLMANTMESTP